MILVCVCVCSSRRAQALKAAELPTFLQGGAHAAELLTEHAGQTHHKAFQLARRHLHGREGGGTQEDDEGKCKGEARDRDPDNEGTRGEGGRKGGFRSGGRMEMKGEGLGERWSGLRSDRKSVV